MVDRESTTDDLVLLHMYHGESLHLGRGDLFTRSHSNSVQGNFIPVGKTFGPCLLYINDGDLSDSGSRSYQESAKWSFSWLNDALYQSWESVDGTLKLSDGRLASGVAVFLGDEDGWQTNNQGSYYQYTTYADAHSPSPLHILSSPTLPPPPLLPSTPKQLC